MISALLDRAFSMPAILVVQSDAITVYTMLNVETTLVQAKDAVGVIPPEVVAPIHAVCAKAASGLGALGDAAAIAGNLAIPLVKQLTATAAQHDENAARYVHWGTTSQDIINTGLMSQQRLSTELIEADLQKLAGAFAAPAQRHRNMPVAARTWLQQALPTTLGRRVAGWPEAVHHMQDHFTVLSAHVSALRLGKAAGTLANLGGHTRAVVQALVHEFDLPLPALLWRGEQDRIAGIGTTLALLVGTLDHSVHDLSLMIQAEVGEVSEPFGAGRGGSPTMPYKHSPVGCATVLAAAVRIPGLTSTLFIALSQEHERALGGWQTQWATLREIACLAADVLNHMRDIVGDLQVDATRIHTNLDLTRGLILGEVVMLALGTDLGRLQTYHVVEAVSRQAVQENKTLHDILVQDAGVLCIWDAIAPRRLSAPLGPIHYLGDTGATVDHVLAEYVHRHP